MSVVRRTLFSIWQKEGISLKTFLSVESYVFRSVIDKSIYSNEQSYEISRKLKKFGGKLLEKWRACGRNQAFFERKHKEWLDGELHLVDQDWTPKAGRPVKDFSDCTHKKQVEKVADLVAETPLNALMVATSSSLHKAGKRTASQVLLKLDSHQSNAAKIKKCLESEVQIPTKYTPDEALALYIDGGYTKHSYKIMQTGAKARNANIYPSYADLLSAKKKCYPDGVLVTETSATVDLQSLVDHTIARIVEAYAELFQNITESNNEKLVAIYKWGCDGSSGHSTYRQSYSNPEKAMIDEHLFTVCIVPLQVQQGTNILWKNSRPSSVRFCRPIKIICQKESADLVRAEVENVKSQISLVTPTTIGSLQVYHEFHLTMIDGKVFAAIAQSSSQICGICKATPKVMNDLDLVKELPVDENLYEYGLSTLHAWIRCFECIIHIAYRLPIKKWQVRISEKDIINERKKKIQNEFRQKMSLLVDIPMAIAGNTNNGNTARRFFSQPNLASEITGVNEEMIKRFGVILRCMACGYEVNVEAFRKYTYETAELFVKEYPWFYMPSSIHKILIHGADIIDNVGLPIGMMSEEALESRNKDARNFRQHHTRKTSRQHTMQDLINALLISSDPFISTLSQKTSSLSSKNVLLDKDVINLLLDFEQQHQLSDSNSSDSE